ncbi:hypothetical protein [Dictyobacter arantiisoli]|uniref:hypothetical protein n=1 Tax=Dictyobacter arantiisoli TaxID=2014874 RepID=UPI0011EE0B2C|nr:hypothetical protein [Dictyobacter arantiisoli]
MTNKRTGLSKGKKLLGTAALVLGMAGVFAPQAAHAATSNSHAYAAPATAAPRQIFCEYPSYPVFVDGSYVCSGGYGGSYGGYPYPFPHPYPFPFPHPYPFPFPHPYPFPFPHPYPFPFPHPYPPYPFSHPFVR